MTFFEFSKQKIEKIKFQDCSESVEIQRNEIRKKKIEK